MDMLFDRVLGRRQAGSMDDYVSGNNDADGPYLLQWVRQHLPQGKKACAARLVAWGGNASGQMIANIDNLGHVTPTPCGGTTTWAACAIAFLCHLERPERPADGRPEAAPAPVQGRCGGCQHLAICNGNTRVRAQQLTGNFWFEDPWLLPERRRSGAASTLLSPLRAKRRRIGWRQPEAFKSPLPL